jgi:hypothetical protein
MTGKFFVICDSQELQQQNQALEAFNGTLEMFNEQLRLCEVNQSKVAPQDAVK